MRRAAKTDANHADIRDRLRELGFEVFDTHALGNGYPDLHASKNGWSVLVEVKASFKARLTPDEWEFKKSWQGPYVIATRVDDVVDVYNKWVENNR